MSEIKELCVCKKVANGNLFKVNREGWLHVESNKPLSEAMVKELGFS